MSKSASIVKKTLLASVLIAPVWLNSPVLAQDILETELGKASWYGKGFDGKKTASGAKFNSDHPVAAHPSWPFGTVVKVTNLANDKALKVKIVDRGPAKKVRKKGVLIDLSHGSAKVLGFAKKGIAEVRLDVLQWGESEN